MVTVTFAWENLQEFGNAWARATDEVARGCQRGVRLGVDEGAREAIATRKWKDRTGEARRMTRGQVTQQTREGAEGVLESAVPYASYLDSGTVPHDIYPRRALALRWYDAGGSPVFAKRVRHPGTRGDGYFGRAVQKAERVLIREIEIGVAKAQESLDR